MDDGLCYLILESPTAAAGAGAADADPAVAPAEAAVSRRAGRPVQFAAALSRPMPLSLVAASVGDLRRACELAPSGHLSTGQSLLDPRTAEWVAQLTGYRRADLVATVKSYIRHQGQWEVAARELALHRNSLRHRIGIATKLINADLDDPDVSANLWLALRGVGHGAAD